MIIVDRAIMAEVQCLVGNNHYPTGGNPKVITRRTSDGFPFQRLQLICAVIEKRLKQSLGSRDVFLNVVGGLRIAEPAADLAVAVAIVSSLTNCAVRPATAFIGELGLGGELRGGRKLEQRISEAVKSGFRRIIVPAVATGQKSLSSYASGVEIIPCHTLKDALKVSLTVSNIDDLLAKKRKPIAVRSHDLTAANDDEYQDD
jgi:DNA repair protein RadA/Sms